MNLLKKILTKSEDQKRSEEVELVVDQTSQEIESRILAARRKLLDLDLDWEKVLSKPPIDIDRLVKIEQDRRDTEDYKNFLETLKKDLFTEGYTEDDLV
jgi:hypothetical protein